ncbi:MAG: TerC family protein [Sphingobacteriaceae bacterium]|nr:MAG: TerC family protein [Sphingobacteriaceae bacterium]
MTDLFTLDALISLITLALLEIVLGIDNVIFVSIVMGRLQEAQQPKARRVWMVTGIAVRVVLLVCLGWLVRNPLKVPIAGYTFELGNLVMLVGGLFLIWKTIKEIHHKLEGDEEELENNAIKKAGITFGAAVGQIILIDMVFSFDSMITAVGLAKHVEVMIVAVVIAMFIMFLFSGKIASFIHKHPTLKMLALAFLVMVGFTLFFEGLEPIHHQHIPKGYVYFSMAFSFGVELLNMRLRKISGKSVKLQEPDPDKIKKK